MNDIYRNIVKRVFDVFLCIVALLLFWWVFAILALLVKINLGSPIIYKSERMGKNETAFCIYKFRSMTNVTDENGILLPAHQRLTKFGKILRSTSLDELPSLFNILKGDLSLVGPRPLLMKYKPYYYEHERVRHSVRPGLTGWAQVNGRNNVTWEEKFDMDIYYVNNISFTLDIKVLFMTVYKVLKRSDIVQYGEKSNSLHIERAHMTSSTSYIVEEEFSKSE